MLSLRSCSVQLGSVPPHSNGATSSCNHHVRLPAAAPTQRSITSTTTGSLLHRPSLHQSSSRTRRTPAATAGGASGDKDGEDSSKQQPDEGASAAGQPQQPDIDRLAAFLTQQAAAMRASLDEGDILPPEEDDDVTPTDSKNSNSENDSGLLSLDSLAALASADAAVPAGAAMPGAAAGQPPLLNTLDALDEFPDDRGFIPEDFAITKLLGKLGVEDVASSRGNSGTSTPSRQDSDDEADGNSSSGGVGLPPGMTPNILVYAARYNSGLPYEGPVTVQLREYLAGSRRVAVNELMVQERLCGPLPFDKWQAAVADPDTRCPVVPLLGYLQAPPSDEAFEMTQDPADTVWLVYKFEGMRPVSLMLQQMDLPEEPAGLVTLFKKKEEVVAAALAARRKLLVSLAAGLLSAISYCHQRGIAHCGIGAGCVVVNTWADKNVDRLLVKLDNFGLARVYQHPLEYGLDQLSLPQLTPAADSGSSSASSSSSSGQGVLLGLEDTDAALQRQEDLQAAALLLAEVWLVGSAAAGASVMDIGSLKRLLFDVFHEDVGLFKEYCLQDEDNYSGFVEFMDDEGGAGWQLLEALMTGQTAAGELLRTARLFSAGAATEGSSSSSGGNPVA